MVEPNSQKYPARRLKNVVNAADPTGTSTLPAAPLVVARIQMTSPLTTRWKPTPIMPSR